tara:strand:- start:1093 stop:1809 length:717 start_codon:yes stop_codon:yes gene_type:complete
MNLFETYEKKKDKYSNINYNKNNKFDRYEEKKEKYILNEDSAGSTSSAVGGFIGRHGQDVDSTYFGPFHPDYGEIEKLLQLQLDRKTVLGKWNMEVTPILKNIFDYVDVEFRVDKAMSEEDKRKIKNFINDTDKMKLIDTGIKYDKPSNRSKEQNQALINKTDDWKSILDVDVDDKKFIDMEKNKIINKKIKYDNYSIRTKKQNDSLINKTDDWQYILKERKDKTSGGVVTMLKNFRR